MEENISVKSANETLEFIKSHEMYLKLTVGSFFVENLKASCELVKHLKHI